MYGDLCKTVCSLENLLLTALFWLVRSSIWRVQFTQWSSSVTAVCCIQTLCGRPGSNQNEVLGLSGSLCLKQWFDENMLRTLSQIKLQTVAVLVPSFESAHLGEDANALSVVQS